MTAEETIEEKLEKLAQAISPDESLVENVMSRIDTKPTSESERIEKLRTKLIAKRFIMNCFTKLAAAVMVIIAVLWAGTFLEKSITQAYAIEQTIEAMRKIDTMHLLCRDWDGSKVEVWIKVNPETGKEAAIYCDSESGHIIVSTPEITYYYDKNENIVRIDKGLAPASWIRFGCFIEDVIKVTKQHNGDIKIYRKYDQERKEEVIVLYGVTDKDEFKYYVDPKSKLPICINMIRSDYPSKGVKSVDKIYYDEALPDGIFQFEIPKGAKVVKNKKQTSQNDKRPDWVRAGKPMTASEIPPQDYAYLAQWLDEHAKSAQEYLIDLFERHQVVIVGEFHHIKEHKEFISELIPRLYHEAGVLCVGWEFCKRIENQRLERLVTAPEYDRELALQIARDQLAHEWNSKEHWDIMEAIWRLNKSLKPDQQKMRLIGLDKDVDFVRLMIIMRTKPQDSAEFQEAVTDAILRDNVMAEQVGKEIVEKGKKGLVFVGRCHDFTHYEFPPEVNFGRPIMGNLLHKKFGDLIFQVWLASGWLPPMEKVMRLRGHKPTGFDLYASPFANILSPAGWDAPEVPLSKIARGYVYFGPRGKLHKNTPIEGFVTDEMFKRYKQYYEIDFGRTFKDAEEVDKYFQNHRFPKP